MIILKKKANIISFYNYQLSTVFNVSVNKNEEAEIMLSNNERKVTVVFSEKIILNKNINNKYIFFKSDEVASANSNKIVL